MTAFAVFVGQKHWFLQCFCTLLRLEFFARKFKTSQIAVFLATMLLKTSQAKNIAVCSGFCLTEYKEQ